ncbi:MAG: transcriptional regulator, TetR family [Anaerolineales bacterium]|nr:transcriptional regulator, TetR family [Anaerolineales bacterium]
MTRSTTSSRRQKEKEDRKEAILAAAREVFFEEGIRRATVEAIAARAEVAKGTVYLYFDTKETIVAHLLLEGLDVLGERLAKAYDESTPASAEARLRRLAAAYLDFFQKEQDYFRLLMAFDRGHFQEAVDADVYEMILHRSLRGLHWVVRAIQQGRESGEFAPGEPKQTAGMLWAALNGALILISHPLRRELLKQEVETLYEGVLETMLRGMKNPKLQNPNSKEGT